MRVAIDVSDLTSESLPKEAEEKEATGEEEGKGEGEVEETGEEAGGAEERTIVDELASFLSERLGREVLVTGSELEVEVEGPAERRRVRQLLKKFLHKYDLKDDYRVISWGEGGFRVKRRRFPRLKALRWF